MSSPDSDENDAIMVSLDDVRDFNVDNILPLPPADNVEIRKWPVSNTHLTLPTICSV